MAYLSRLEQLTTDYHEKAKRSGEWSVYLQAHGLANTCLAMARTEKRAKKVYAIERDWYKGNHPLIYSDHQKLTCEHKQLLADYRNETKENIEKLKSLEYLFDIDNIFCEDNLCHAEGFSRQVFSESKKISDGLVGIVKSVMKSSIDVLISAGSSPPCPFAVIGLGSLAKGEATPYSDIEYAFIVEAEDQKDYFLSLAMDSYFRIGNCGESPLKCFDIHDQDLKKESDQTKLTNPVVGFRIDGISPKAGHIPTGKPEGQSLILTVDGLVEVYKSAAFSPSGELAGGLSDILSSTVVVLSHNDGAILHVDFLNKLSTFEAGEASTNDKVFEKRLKTFAKDIENYNFLPEFKSFGPPDNFDIKVKTDIFRYPTLLATDIGIYLGLQSRYAWDKYSDLTRLECMSSENCRFMHIVLGLSVYIRICAYFFSKSQTNLVSLYTCTSGKKDDRYHVPFKIFVTFGCLIVPIKRSIRQSLEQYITNLDSCVPYGKSKSSTAEEEHYAFFYNVFLRINSDFMTKAEVMFFAGDHALALKQIYAGVGKENVHKGCEEFLSSSKANLGTVRSIESERKAVEVCCYLLLANGMHDYAISYLKWLDCHSATELDKARWKVLVADALNNVLSYKLAVGYLNEAFVMLKKELGNNEHNTLYANLLSELNKGAELHPNGLELLRITSHAYKCMADTFLKVKFFVQSEELIKVSMKISEHLLNVVDDGHKMMVSLTESLAEIYFDQGNYSESLKYHEDCLHKLQSRHGEHVNHPDVARAYSSIAKVRSKNGKFSESISWCKKSKELLEAYFGIDVKYNLELAQCSEDFGNIFLSMGNLPKALDYFRKSLIMKGLVLGKNSVDPIIATSHYLVGEVYQKQGLWHEALKHFKRALSILEASKFVEVESHPFSAAIMGSIAAASSNIGDLGVSLEFSIKSINVMTVSYIERRPVVLSGYREAVGLHQEMGKLRAMLEWSKDFLNITKISVGEDINNPDVALCHRVIGDVHLEMGNNTEALEDYNRSLRMLKAFYGKQNNLEVASIYTKIGCVYCKLDEYNESLKYHKLSSKMLKSIYGKRTNHPQVAISYMHIGAVYSRRGHYKDSLRYSKRSLNMLKALHGESTNHIDIAHVYANISTAYTKTLNSNLALKNLTKSLDMMKVVYNKDTNHPEIAAAYKDIGLIFLGKAQGEESVEHFKKAVMILKSLHGEDTNHTEIAIVYRHIGNVYSMEGAHDSALDYYMKSLKMLNELHGKDVNHSNIALTYRCIGFLCCRKEEYAKSVSHHMEALTMFKAMYGENTNHPEIAESYRNIGAVHTLMADYAQSLEYHNKSLDMKRAVYGIEAKHRDIATSLMVIGCVYSEIGDYSKSKDYCTKSLRMMTSVHGKSSPHPDIAICCRAVSDMHNMNGDYLISLEHCKKSIKIMEEVHGITSNHPDIAACYRAIGDVYRRKGDYIESLEYFIKALDMMEAKYSIDVYQPNIAASHQSIGGVHSERGEYDESLYHYQKSLGIFEAVYGAECNNLTIAISHANIGDVLAKRKQYTESLESFKISLKMMKAVFGDCNHPHIALNYRNIGIMHSELGEYDQALDCCMKSLDMMKAVYGEDTNHPNIATSYWVLGDLHCLMEHNSTIGLENYLKSLDMNMTLFGLNAKHLDLQSEYRNIAREFCITGNFSKSYKCYVKLFGLEIRPVGL